MAGRKVCSFLTFFVLFSYSSSGFQFNVGGKDGWKINPSESYNHWAERLRFQVNDTLLFKYKEGSDSVLVVDKDDYTLCNTANPIAKSDDGQSTFKFERSGPFFFISGNKSSCGCGQKLVVVVLAVRSSRPPSPPPEAPSPTPRVGEPPSPASSPAEAPAPEDNPSANSTPAAHPPRRSFAAAAGWGLTAVMVPAVSALINVCLAV
ncbi:early nodulin-like protein 1 [Striga asiatica]|uniref:Early nodulin-like protein 1 n=1 Tax=Striga asiatica TaxID=4170 RepID=A0A5A7QDR0_STRAF|nr:early nodulin-like protein 1 [Striga asiatica]